MEKVFQVSEFNEYINLYLKQAGELVVEGEISEVNVSQGKWLFITIKDSSSNLGVFAPVYNISGWAALTVGMKVHVYGTPGLFSKSGRFSLNATRIVPSGEGALRLAYEKLKQQLEKEGLFSEGRKRTIARFPQNIGLITAKNSEAYNDFIKISRERLGGLNIYLISVNVQGRDSVPSIISAFNYFNTSDLNLDCVVLCRGGGSLEDLQSFNDEQVVRSIFASRFPVVVGVGHERDISLCDLVADLRASTPSNAAELIIPHRDQLLGQVTYSTKILSTQLSSILNSKLHRLNQLVTILDKSISTPIQNFNQLLTRFRSTPIAFQSQIQNLTQKLTSHVSRLDSGIQIWLKNNNQALDQLIRLLQTFDHHSVIKRGYSLTTSSTGKILHSIKDAAKGDSIYTEVRDGKISSIIS